MNKMLKYWIIAILLAIPTFGISIIIMILIMLSRKNDEKIAKTDLINFIINTFDSGKEAAIRSNWKNVGEASIRSDAIDSVVVYFLFKIYGELIYVDGQEYRGQITHPITQDNIYFTLNLSRDDTVLIFDTEKEVRRGLVFYSEQNDRHHKIRMQLRKN